MPNLTFVLPHGLYWAGLVLFPLFAMWIAGRQRRLGVIFAGIATPVEAAGIGTYGALVVAALHRRLTWIEIREATLITLKATAMVLWIIFGASAFVGFYLLNGGQEFVSNTLIATGLGSYGILLNMMIILVVLGMFLDWVGILLLAVPIFVPLVTTLTFDGLLGLPGVPAEDVPLDKIGHPQIRCDDG